MEDTLISFETAKLAKEKGLNVSIYGTRCFFENNGTEGQVRYPGHEGIGDYIDEENGYLRPSQSLLQKWLRDVYNIHLIIIPNFCKITRDLENFTVQCFGKYGREEYIYEYTTYEKSLEAGLQEALKLIK